MIPIIYESSETAFESNGLGRLRDCISCDVTEERNGIYECDFEYPVDGANFDLIQCGRVVAITHDDSGDIQPFDIVSYTKPIDGVVKFHAVHVSYRQSGIVAQGSGINSLAAAMTMLTSSAQPSNPFTYEADFTSTAYMASADGTPRSVRQFLGGIEGSILDAYGGEYEFDRFRVILHRSRGVTRDFVIRYGVNMLDYSEDTDFSNTFSACVPYWRGNDNGSDIIVKGNRVDYGGTAYNGRNICVPLDLSDKFEDAPTTAQLEAEALRVMQSKQSTLPAQTISVDFIRLQDMGYEGLDNLLQCNLCDTIRVEFPRYNMSGSFKIVRTVYDVLQDKYDSMELGQLSTTLAEALGIQSQTDTLQSIDDLTVNDLNVTGGAAIAGALTVGGASIGDFILEQTANANGIYRKWNSGYMEQFGVATSSAQSGTVGMTITLPVAFNNTSYYVYLSPSNNMNSNTILLTEINSSSSSIIRTTTTFDVTIFKSGNAYAQRFYWFAFGRWK